MSRFRILFQHAKYSELQSYALLQDFLLFISFTRHAIMFITNKVLLPILRLLNNSDLKIARLVFKCWCSCFSKCVFDKIRVFMQDEDYDVFKAATQDLISSKCVRTL